MLNLPARNVAKALAVLVVLALIVDLLMQKTSDPQTGMWACYWASGVIVVGVMAGWDQPVAWGVIFFEGVGLPSWLLGVLLGKPVYVTSVLIHIIPLVAGLLYMRRFNELPRFSVLGAWLLSVVPFAVAWYVCDPSRMIDLTHLNRSMLPFILPPSLAVLYGSRGCDRNLNRTRGLAAGPIASLPQVGLSGGNRVWGHRRDETE